MDCILHPTGATRGDEREYACSRCGAAWWHLLPPERLHRMCGGLLRAPATLVQPAERGACAHRGAETRREECRTCRGKTRVKVFACALHGECTLERPIECAAVCATCPDWTGGPESLRHPIAQSTIPPHPNAGHWWHDEGRVVYRTAAPVALTLRVREPNPPADGASTPTRPALRPSTLLLRFPHGIGDHLMFTIVLRHLQVLRPDLRIDVQCNAACVPALSGLCHRVFSLDPLLSTLDRRYDFVYDVPFYESDAVHPDLRTSKAGKCLWESFGIAPRAELATYQITIPGDAHRHAAAWIAATIAPREHTRGLGRKHALDVRRENAESPDPASPSVSSPGANRFALVHYRGHSARARKDLPERAVQEAIEAIAAAGVVPVLLDWTGKSPLRAHPAVVPLGDDAALWGRASGADVATLAALARRAALCVGIDSGPGHVFGAAMSGQLSAVSNQPLSASLPTADSPPTIIVWTKHHPVHFYGLSPHVTHLLPVDHERNIHGDPAVCREFFQRHYRHRTYTHLGRALSQLCRDVIERSAVSNQRSAISGQQSAVSNQRSAIRPTS